MELIFSNIKLFLCNFNGSLSIKEHDVPEEASEIYQSIQGLEYDHPMTDKQNLHSDIKHIANDVKKSKIEYDLSHGEAH